MEPTENTLVRAGVGDIETRWQRWRRFSFERWIYRRLSDHVTGSESVPLSWDSKRIMDRGTERVIAFCNDAHEIGIGYPDKWHVIMRREAFHKMIRWYLYEWIVREWLGLRRYLWYKLLFRRVSHYKVFSSALPDTPVKEI